MVSIVNSTYFIILVFFNPGIKAMGLQGGNFREGIGIIVLSLVGLRDTIFSDLCSQYPVSLSRDRLTHEVDDPATKVLANERSPFLERNPYPS